MKGLGALRWLCAIVLWAPTARADDCPTLATPVQVEALADEALRAWAVMDVATFEDASDEVVLLLPCLGRVVDPPLAARLHAVAALRRYRSGGVDAAFPSALAATVLEPRGELLADLLDEGHALRERVAEAASERDATERAPAPARGVALWFDGTAGRERPTERATLLQLGPEAGAITTTRYLMPGDPLPAYLTQPRVRTALAIAAGVLAAAAGATYGGAWAERARFDALPDGEEDALRTAQASTNALVGVSAGLAAGAVGTGLGAAFVGRR